MSALRNLCERCVLLEDGRVHYEGSPAEVIRRYLNLTIPAEVEATGQRFWPDAATAPRCEDMRLCSVRLLDAAGKVGTAYEADELVRVEVGYEVTARLRGARWDLSLLTDEGDLAFTATDHLFQPEVQDPGFYRSVCTIPGGLLNRRNYVVKLHSVVPGERALIREAEYLRFTVAGAGNQSSIYPETWPGILCPTIGWTVTPTPRVEVLSAGGRQMELVA